MSRLDDETLYGRYENLRRQKKQSYYRIYQRCLNTIRWFSRRGCLSCFYEIPEFLFGIPTPKITVEECAEYIIPLLHDSNPHLRVKFIPPNVLFIDWRKSTS